MFKKWLNYGKNLILFMEKVLRGTNFHTNRDEINKVLYLLSIYKHSKGKNDLTPEENKKVRLLCDEYVNSI